MKKTNYRDQAKRGWLFPASVVITVTMLAPVLATTWISGRSLAEKMLTNMTQPFFLTLITLLILGWVLIRRSQERIIGWILVLGATLLWVLACPFFTKQLYVAWENSIGDIPPIDEPFDYVIVLGGGTSAAPDGRPQFSDAGDRVGYAAQLYWTGKAKHLVTTGDPPKLTGSLSGIFESQDDGSEQTRQIWLKLGIPADAITDLEGENTSAEIASLKEHPEWWRDHRCAILTSAFHLPRAMTLARRAGVTVSPLAADYRSGRGPLTLNAFMPNGSELNRWHFLLKEWLALRIRR